jgi:hypothetical protein
MEEGSSLGQLKKQIVGISIWVHENSKGEALDHSILREPKSPLSRKIKRECSLSLSLSRRRLLALFQSLSGTSSFVGLESRVKIRGERRGEEIRI